MIRKHPWFVRWRETVQNLKRNITVLYFAVLNAGTPWHAKALAILVVAYALSPIDLIPDFVPVLGYLDDLIVLPLGIWFALQLVPPRVLVEARQLAAAHPRINRTLGFVASAVIIAFYAVIALLLWRSFVRPPE